MEQRSIVRLPRGVEPPLRVFLNGVEQQAGSDYELRGDRLVFAKPLAKEGRLGFWRWAMMVFGVAGTYRKNDVVDVQYEVGGRTRLANDLEFESDTDR